MSRELRLATQHVNRSITEEGKRRCPETRLAALRGVLLLHVVQCDACLTTRMKADPWPARLRVLWARAADLIAKRMSRFK